MDAAKKETKIDLKYRYAYSTNDLQTKCSPETSDSFGPKPNKDTETQIKTSVTNKDAKLMVIGQTDGKIMYWRPRRINANSTNSDQAHQANQLKCYQFNGHYNAPIHALTYGLCDILDPEHNKYGLIISGAADSKISFGIHCIERIKPKKFPYWN